MGDRQRKAKGFLVLACLITVVCLAQRVALLHALQPTVMLSDPVSSTNAASNSGSSFALSSCQLSSQSLLIAQPVFFDCAFPMLMVLLAIVVLHDTASGTFPKTRAVSSPVLRIHLKNCVFRE